MPHENNSNLEIEEVVDFVLREAVRLKKVCDIYGIGTIGASLEMVVAEARRLISGESDSGVTEQ